MAAEFFPFLKYIPLIGKKYDASNSKIKDFFGSLKQKYQTHQSDYQDGQIRDFTDALIYAKFDSLKNEKESAPYLTDGNLSMALSDLFSGKKYLFIKFFRV